MRVLMLSGQRGVVFGGHQVQQQETAAALRELGVSVSFADSVALSSLRNVDIVHAWWPDLNDARTVRSAGLPLVASTVYIPVHQLAEDNAAKLMATRLQMAAALGWQAIKGGHVRGAEALLSDRNWLRLLFETADLLLPNSVGEGELLRRDLGVSTPIHVVPNGYNPSLFNLDQAPDWSSRTGVVLAGRFEPHKNQLLLIRALAETGLSLQLIGAEHPHHSAYYRACVSASRRAPNVELLGAVPQTQVADLMRNARVHVLPSRWETTGLVSLEAAACGCNVVVTESGHVHEYLGDRAWYCLELTEKSLRRAVLAAHSSEQRASLTQHVAKHFTWRDAAESTLMAYKTAIGRRRGQ